MDNQNVAEQNEVKEQQANPQSEQNQPEASQSQNQSRGKRGKIIAGAVVAVLLVVALYLANRYWIAPIMNHQAEAKALTGGSHPAAPDFSLTDISGQKLSLADYKGKVVVLDFWATWCGPCRMETPELVRLHKEFQSRGVEMIGLSTENPDASARSVSDFVREFNVDYQIGWAQPEVAQIMMAGRTSISQRFIIARNGRVIRRFIGFNPETTPTQLKEALEQALKEEG